MLIELAHCSIHPHSFIKIAKKRFSDKIFGDFLFLEWGSGGSPVSSSSLYVVVKPKTRICRIAKKSQVAKKNVTADDGGGREVS